MNTQYEDQTAKLRLLSRWLLTLCSLCHDEHTFLPIGAQSRYESMRNGYNMVVLSHMPKTKKNNFATRAVFDPVSNR